MNYTLGFLGNQTKTLTANLNFELASLNPGLSLEIDIESAQTESVTGVEIIMGMSTIIKADSIAGSKR